MLASSPSTAGSDRQDVRVDVDYGDGVVVAPNQTRTVLTTWTNQRTDIIEIEASLDFPSEWQVRPQGFRSALEPGAGVSTQWEVTAPEGTLVAITNVGDLRTKVVGRPVAAPVPVTLLGATAFRTSPVYPITDPTAAIEDVFAPETGEPVPWVLKHASGYSLPLEEDFGTRAGVLYVENLVHSPDEREVWVLIDPSCPMRYWVNGTESGRNDQYRRIRPNQHAAEGIGAMVRLKQGWNRVLVKLVHDGQHAAPELHLGFTSADQLRHHQWDLLRTHVPDGM